MENKRPFILISNDDGYEAKGIHCLVELIRDMADILVCMCFFCNTSFNVDLSTSGTGFGYMVM